MRIAVQIPVECFGDSRYMAKTLDLCEGGMAIQFSGRIPKENSLRFSLELPGMDQSLEIEGELAWEGNDKQAGVRFKDATDDQRKMLSQWLSSQLPEPEQDDPPVICRLPTSALGAAISLPVRRFRGGRALLFRSRPPTWKCMPKDRTGGASRIRHGGGVPPEDDRATRSGATPGHGFGGQGRYSRASGCTRWTGQVVSSGHPLRPELRRAESPGPKTHSSICSGTSFRCRSKASWSKCANGARLPSRLHSNALAIES